MNNEAEIKKANPLTLDLLEQTASAEFLPPPPARQPKPRNGKKIKFSDQYLDELNFSTSQVIAWAGFLRSGEFTYSKSDRNHADFLKNHLLRGDVTFSEDGKYVIIRLKRSKTDYKFRGVDIVLAASDHACCPVTALRKLFEEDPQELTEPLFRWHTKESAFTYDRLVSRLRARVHECGIKDPNGFSGHSFRRGAAQTAENHGFLDHEIKECGRWTSEAFRGYFSKSMQAVYGLNKRLFTRTAPALNEAILATSAVVL